MKRILIALFVGFLLHSCCPLTHASGPAPEAKVEVNDSEKEAADIRPVPETKNAWDFVDKWVISGNAIGNAAGAVLGQTIGAALFPPIGWAIGSFIGSSIGGMVGELIDNKIYKAYNYAAFNRPPFGEGGLYLRGVGPYEQLFYQIDARGVNMGNIFTNITHFGLNLLARSIPGASWLIKPGFLVACDYFAGVLGDNLDGLVDLASIGGEIDKKRAIVASQQTTGTTTTVPQRGGLTLKELYEAAKRALISNPSPENAEKAKQAFEDYNAGFQSRDKPEINQIESDAP